MSDPNKRLPNVKIGTTKKFQMQKDVKRCKMPKTIENSGFFLPCLSQNVPDQPNKLLHLLIICFSLFRPLDGIFFYSCSLLCSNLSRTFFVKNATITQNLLFTHSEPKSQFWSEVCLLLPKRCTPKI